MKRSEVETFEKLVAQLNGLYQEMLMLAKKSPNDAVNTFKINLVNASLAQCNELFGEKYRPFPDFEDFSIDELPSNSDVTFIVAQYIECAEKLRADNIIGSYQNWYWVVEGETLSDDYKGAIRTSAPKKIRAK